jgi:hypothetical protein
VAALLVGVNPVRRLPLLPTPFLPMVDDVAR